MKYIFTANILQKFPLNSIPQCYSFAESLVSQARRMNELKIYKDREKILKTLATRSRRLETANRSKKYWPSRNQLKAKSVLLKISEMEVSYWGIEKTNFSSVSQFHICHISRHKYYDLFIHILFKIGDEKPNILYECITFYESISHENAMNPWAYH